MRLNFKTVMAAGFVLVGAATIHPAPAEAQWRGGRYFPEGDTYAPHAFRGGAYGPRYYGGRYYGSRGYYGRRGYYGGGYYGSRYRYGYPYGYYRRPYYNGGAVAAGVIGGLALGAIASTAANPYYGPRCVYQPRRVVNAYGRVVVRRIRTCY
ncbi:hypothetical protein [Microvirga zambiensis]|uniref:hypothetical protein n=1 Tax=Microvirga zambiensis TaxID=1402137 RepID=UPI00191F5246|nr:hypothetical protein [Microvirga zambiensis]